MQCSVCGGSSQKRQCSDACRRESARRYSLQRYYALKVAATCVMCGKEWFAAANGAKFCSQKCAQRHKSDVMVPMATCGCCGVEFKPKKNMYRAYCSRQCAFNQWKKEADESAAMREGLRLIKLALRQFRNGMEAIVRRGNQRRQLMARQSGTCELCSVTFSRKSTSQTQCESCREARKRAEKRAYKQRRKQLIREKSGLATRDVWERDPLCHLCGCETVIGDGHDPTDARYANADHLIPISRGGRHSVENIRIACRKCNLAKSNMTRDEFLSLPQHEQDNRRVRFLGKVCHG